MTDNFNQVQRSVSDLKDEIRNNVEDAVEDSMGTKVGGVAHALKWRIDRQRIDATGNLKNSIHARKLPTTSSDEIVKVGIFAAPYWKYVEYGTGMGSPYPSPEVAPYQPIYRWIVAKGITPRPSSDDIETQADLAYAIQRSISSGTYANPFVRPTWRGRSGRQNVSDAIDNAVREALMSF